MQRFHNKCLSKKPADRLGTKGDIEEILAHPWFADLDVKQVESREINPEFKPKLSQNILDVQNFDKMFTSEEAEHSVLPLSA